MQKGSCSGKNSRLLRVAYTWIIQGCRFPEGPNSLMSENRTDCASCRIVKG